MPSGRASRASRDPGRGCEDGTPAGGPRPLIFVVFGPGGVGKGTLVAELMRKRDRLWLSRSWTTRSRRPSEDPDAYVFASREAFEQRRDAGGFVEWTEFPANGQLYGTPTLDPPAGHEDDDVVLEIEVDGASQVKSRYPDAVLVLVAVPSLEVQAGRLRARGDSEASISKRLEVGVDEDRRGRAIAAHVIVNDDLSTATQELAGIVDAHRARRSTGR